MNPAEERMAQYLGRPKRNKYGARGFRDPCGTWWDSRAEHDYWLLLKDRERHGEIRDLRRQWEIEIIPAYTDWSGHRRRAHVFTVDFRYTETSSGHEYADDVKGVITEAFAIRWDLAQSLYSQTGIRWRLIDAKTLAPVGRGTARPRWRRAR